MNKTSVCIALALLAAAILPAQGNRKSPHETVKWTVNGQTVTISYGRPYLKGRKAVGGSLIPYGQVYRMGADEATKLTTPVDLKIGDLAVPAGSYALFTLATTDGWTLIVNKTADQWGAFKYDKSQDLGRVPMQVASTSAPVEQFTIAFKEKGPNSATLMTTWEKTEASVDVTAK